MGMHEGDGKKLWTALKIVEESEWKGTFFTGLGIFQYMVQKPKSLLIRTHVTEELSGKNGK